MGNMFIVDGVEYKIVRNPHTAGPMIARVDNFPIENRKEICRRFLRMHGCLKLMSQQPGHITAVSAFFPGSNWR